MLLVVDGRYAVRHGLCFLVTTGKRPGTSRFNVQDNTGDMHVGEKNNNFACTVGLLPLQVTVLQTAVLKFFERSPAD